MITQQILVPVVSDDYLAELQREIDAARDAQDHARVKRLLRKHDRLTKARQLRPLAMGDMF